MSPYLSYPEDKWLSLWTASNSDPSTLSRWRPHWPPPFPPSLYPWIIAVVRFYSHFASSVSLDPEALWERKTVGGRRMVRRAENRSQKPRARVWVLRIGSEGFGERYKLQQRGFGRSLNISKVLKYFRHSGWPLLALQGCWNIACDVLVSCTLWSLHIGVKFPPKWCQDKTLLCFVTVALWSLFTRSNTAGSVNNLTITIEKLKSTRWLRRQLLGNGPTNS